MFLVYSFPYSVIWYVRSHSGMVFVLYSTAPHHARAKGGGRGGGGGGCWLLGRMSKTVLLSTEVGLWM